MFLKEQGFLMPFFKKNYWELSVQVDPCDLSRLLLHKLYLPGFSLMDITDFMLNQAQMRSCCGPCVATGLFAESLVSISNYANFCM